jgi:outer membrane lipoprotein-sorting protein
MLDTQNSAVPGRLGLAIAVLLLLSTSGCQPANTNANANANSATANANSSTVNANSNSESADRGPTINTREPDKYSATLTFSLETEGGDKAIGIPTLSMQVARSGADRRVEFKLPDGSPLIYIDHDNRHYVIAPSRKQYAELTKDATGIQLHKMLTPGQLVEDLKGRKGVEPAGEGVINGRAADKYRYSASTNTNTKAGEVKAEAFVYVDKETGLPLRVEMLAESSGDVKGVKAARVIAEMKDIKTEIAPSLFEVPAGYAQVAPEKIRQQIDALTNAVAAILKAMISSPGSQRAASPSPAGASTSPAAAKP